MSILSTYGLLSFSEQSDAFSVEDVTISLTSKLLYTLAVDDVSVTSSIEKILMVRGDGVFSLYETLPGLKITTSSSPVFNGESSYEGSTLPALELTGGFGEGLSLSESLPVPEIQGQFGMLCGGGEIGTLSSVGSISSEVPMTLSKEIPALQSSSISLWFSSLSSKLPTPHVEISMSGGPFSLSKMLPVINPTISMVAGDWVTSGVFYLEKKLPSSRLSGSMSADGWIEVAAGIPPITLSAMMVAGRNFTLSSVLPVGSVSSDIGGYGVSVGGILPSLFSIGSDMYELVDDEILRHVR